MGDLELTRQKIKSSQLVGNGREYLTGVDSDLNLFLAGGKQDCFISVIGLFSKM